MKRTSLLTGISLLGLILCNPFTIAAPQQGATRSGGRAAVSEAGVPSVNEAKPAVDLAVRAAGIEVAWLHHAATYPYFLRAEPSPNQESITLSGFVPNHQLRQKALSIAVRTALEIPLTDHITVQPNMELPVWSETSKNQSSVVKDQLEKALPNAAKYVQVQVDSNGITTITGRVDDLADRRKIIHALQGIPGCTAVRYGLHVGSPIASPVTHAATKEAPSAPLARSGDRATTEAPMSRTTWTQLPDRNRPTVAAKREVQQPVENSALTKPGSAATGNNKSLIAATAASSNSGNIDQVQFTVSSVSGLTPPSPVIMLGSPVISHNGQPNILADLPALPLNPPKSNPPSSENEEITKSIVNVAGPKPAKLETPLPVIQLQPSGLQQLENVEQIGVKPH